MKRKNVFLLFETMIRNDKLKLSLVSGCGMTFFTHAYSFFNSAFTNDRMMFFGDPIFTTASGGKWFAQFYSFVHAWSYIPWFIGILMMLYISLSVFATIEILGLKCSLSYFLVAGLFATNISVVTGNFYGGDDFTFALLMAVGSAWIWSVGGDKVRSDSFIRKNTIVRIIVSALPICICLGIYGSYATAAPTLVILSCVLMLISGKDALYVFKRGVEYIASFFVGMGLYYIILRIFLSVQNLQMQEYMGENRLVTGASFEEIISYIVLAYKNSIKFWIGRGDGYTLIPKGLSVILLVLTIILFGTQIVVNKKNINNLAKIGLLLFLIGIFPLSTGLIYVLAFGNVHYLMIFSYVFLYIGLVKLLEMTLVPNMNLECKDEPIKEKTGLDGFYRKSVCCVATFTVLIVGFVVYRGVMHANMAYNALQKSTTDTISIATRLMDRIESCEGAKGTEMVVFIGDLCDNPYYRMPQGEGAYWKGHISGLGSASYPTSFAYYGNTRTFLHEVMGFYRDIAYYRLGTLSGAYTQEDEDMISEMPVFPADGSVMKLGETIVVRLSDVE